MKLKDPKWTDRELLRRYNAALHTIRKSGGRTPTIEKEVCFLQKDIEAYGFEFFASHYVGNQLKRLETIAERI